MADRMKEIEARLKAMANPWKPEECGIQADGYVPECSYLGETLIALSKDYEGDREDWAVVANAPADLTWLLNRLRTAHNLLSVFRDHAALADSAPELLVRDVEEIDAFLAEREHTMATTETSSPLSVRADSSKENG
jgi:hypothetical protein